MIQIITDTSANLPEEMRKELNIEVIPFHYTVDGVEYQAMSNAGVRPSVDGTGRWLETHIFDFHGDLYGKVLRVQLLEKIRNERKFSSVAELRAQLEHDMEYCKEKVK